MSNKVTALRDALELLANGSHLALTGFAITRNATAVAHEVVRCQYRDLHVSQVVGGIETDLLAAGGCLRRLTYSGGSLDRFGSLAGVNHALSTGAVDVEEYSSLALALRFHAGALGLPYVSTRSMLGSDLLNPLLATGEVGIGVDPFEGRPVVDMAALHPDLAIVHADVADACGNAAVAGPTWSIRDSALAARQVIVVCEAIVPVGDIDPGHVTVPGVAVDAVVHLPHAAHPTAVYERYDYDREHLSAYAARAREGPESHVRYLEDFVFGVRDHREYLERTGTGR